MKIRDLENNTIFSPENPFLGLVTDVYTKEGKKGDYMGGTISDGKDSIKLRIWSDYKQSLEDIVKQGNAIRIISGAVSEWNDELQLKIEGAVEVTDFSEISAAGLIPASETSKEDLINRMNDFISSYVHNPKLLKLIDLIKESPLWAYYTEIPAARSNHHNYIHGLLEHSVSVVDLALAISHRQRGNYAVDQGVLVTAALFHDLGKIHEYNRTDFGLLKDFSRIGHQLGHLVIGASLVRNFATNNNIKCPEIDHVSHIILSHHGWVSNGWGSAVDPKSLEALIVSQADVLDAMINASYIALDNAQPDESVYVGSIQRSLHYFPTQN